MMKVSNIYFMKRSVRSSWISLRLIETNHKSDLYIGLILFFIGFKKQKKTKSPKSTEKIILEKIRFFFLEFNGRMIFDSFTRQLSSYGNRFIFITVKTVLFIEIEFTKTVREQKCGHYWVKSPDSRTPKSSST